jgi:protein-tyrosine phosphatase
MAPAVLDLRTADDPRDVVHRAVQALAEGKLVALPTETVYGVAASALNEKAVQRLAEIKGRRPDQPFALAIKSVEDALDYVPEFPLLAQRLARRCWPGPLTLVFDDTHPESLVRQLPKSVQNLVSPKGTVGLRVPAHDLVLAVLRLTAGPLALTSANMTGEEDTVTAEQVIQSLGDSVDLVLDDGRSKFGQPSSVVRVHQNSLSILRRGVISEHSLRQLASLMIAFVCTGNTCRSPMAEVMMRARIAERFKCRPDELDKHGVIVFSAGIAAMAGRRASPEAVEIMRETGLELGEHESQPLSERLVRFADVLFAMTRGHLDGIVAQWPAAASRTVLLSRDGADIADPIGGTSEMYRRCARQIDRQLELWLEDRDFQALLADPGLGSDK